MGHNSRTGSERAALDILDVASSGADGGWQMRRNLSEHDARRFLVAGPLALLTTKWRTGQDVLPVAWSMPVSAEPPLIGVCVHPSRHSHDMIRFSEEFALNFPGPELLNHAAYF